MAELRPGAHRDRRPHPDAAGASRPWSTRSAWRTRSRTNGQAIQMIDEVRHTTDFRAPDTEAARSGDHERATASTVILRGDDLVAFSGHGPCHGPGIATRSVSVAPISARDAHQRGSDLMDPAHVALDQHPEAPRRTDPVDWPTSWRGADGGPEHQTAARAGPALPREEQAARAGPVREQAVHLRGPREAEGRHRGRELRRRRGMVVTGVSPLLAAAFPTIRPVARPPTISPPTAAAIETPRPPTRLRRPRRRRGLVHRARRAAHPRPQLPAH